MTRSTDRPFLTSLPRFALGEPPPNSAPLRTPESRRKAQLLEEIVRGLRAAASAQGSGPQPKPKR